MTKSLNPVILGPLGPAQVACIRSWRRSGFSVGFIQVADGWELPFVKSAVASYLKISPDTLKTADGIEQICSFLDLHNATGITCLSYSLARWLHAIRGLIPRQTELWIPKLGVIDKLESKIEQTRLAQSVGFDLLPSFQVDKLARQSIPDDVFPIVVRPDDPTTVCPIFKMKYFEDRAALSSFVANLERVDRPMLAQPYVRGRNFVIHGYRTRNQENGLAGFRVDHMFDGVTLTLSPSAIPAELSEKCKKFVEEIGLFGIYHFEFLHDPKNNSYYFLEINGRFGGTTAKVYRCGFDEPMLLLYCHNNGLSKPGNIQHQITATSKQALIKCLLQSFRGLTTIFDYPHGTTYDRLCNFLPGFFLWKDEIIDWHDPQITVAYFLQKIYQS